jgi:glutamate racemase
MDNRAIGVFDSGIGGLTVLRELFDRFPGENFIYLGDTARLPYGSKSPETIRKYSEQNLDFLIRQDVKALVIACNSASSQMQESSYKNIPVYNVIQPGAEQALKTSETKRVCVLGTRATIASAAYDKKLKELDSSVSVFSQACPLFVPLAEEGWVDDPVTNIIVYRYVSQVMVHNPDTLILGCTHYPILKNAIARVCGSAVQLVDSGEAISLKLKSDMDSGRIGKADNQVLHQKILTTDESDHFIGLAKKLLSPFVIHHFETVNV